VSNVSSSDQNASGDIGDARLTDVLLQLESSKRDARVWLETDSGMGEVLLHRGSIVGARLGVAKGRTALLRLLSVNDGRFGIESCAVAGDSPLIANVGELIELHKSRQEQWQLLCSRAPPLSCVPKLTPAGADVRDASRGIQRVIFVLIDGRRTLMQVLEESSFDPVEGLKVVIKALDDGLVLHAPQPSTLFPTAPAGDASGVMPRFATPAPLPRLDPTAPTQYGNPASWRHSTLVGIGKGEAVAPDLPRSLAPSPIIDLGQRASGSSERETGGNFEFPSRTKTVTEGFGLGKFLSGARSNKSIRTEAIDTRWSATESAPPENDARTTGGEGPTDVAEPKIGPIAPKEIQEAVAGDAGQPSEEFAAAPVVHKAEEARRFVDRYEILIRIGRGGMGTVYLCRLSSVGVGFRRLFALKLLRSHLSQDTQAAKDFIEEARVAGFLHHPNVVAVMDAGFHGKQPYLVMDYVEGCSLKQLMKGCPKRSPHFVLPVAIDALAGLHAAHMLQDEAGTNIQLVHCDVSPENMLIGIDGTCRLTDFGVARKANRTLGSTTRGKPGYVSPEQISGQSFDHRADIFSMGVVLWNSLTGQKLFAGESVEDTLAQVCNKLIPTPSSCGADCSAALDRLVLKALARNPDERFSSAEDMLSELRAVAVAEQGLATTIEIAAWVREAFGSELTERRLAVLDASRRPTVPPGDDSHVAAADPPPLSRAFAAVSGSEPPELNSPTIALSGKSGRSQRAMLIVAGVLALAAVIATVLFPRHVVKLFRMSTDAVESSGQVQVDVNSLILGSQSASPIPSAAEVQQAPTRDLTNKKQSPLPSAQIPGRDPSKTETGQP
jgi:serine/threonine protein kinase